MRVNNYPLCNQLLYQTLILWNHGDLFSRTELHNRATRKKVLREGRERQKINI